MIRRILRKVFPKKEPSKPITLTVHQDGQKYVIEGMSGSTILQLAKKHHIDIPHYCGGCCRCGTCVVEILSGSEHLNRKMGNEGMVLGLEKSEKGHRLACQAIVNDNIEILIPEWF